MKFVAANACWGSSIPTPDVTTPAPNAACATTLRVFVFLRATGPPSSNYRDNSRSANAGDAKSDHGNGQPGRFRPKTPTFSTLRDGRSTDGRIGCRHSHHSWNAHHGAPTTSARVGRTTPRNSAVRQGPKDRAVLVRMAHAWLPRKGQTKT